MFGKGKKKIKTGIIRKKYNDDIAANIARGKSAEVDIIYRDIKSQRDELWDTASSYEQKGLVDEAKKLMPAILDLDSRIDNLQKRKQSYRTIDTVATISSKLDNTTSKQSDEELIEYTKFKAEEIKENKIYGHDLANDLMNVEKGLYASQEVAEAVGRDNKGHIPNSKQSELLYNKLRSEVQTKKKTVSANMGQLEQAVLEATA